MTLSDLCWWLKKDSPPRSAPIPKILPSPKLKKGCRVYLKGSTPIFGTIVDETWWEQSNWTPTEHYWVVRWDNAPKDWKVDTGAYYGDDEIGLLTPEKAEELAAMLLST